MEAEIKQELIRHFVDGFELLDVRPVSEWARENVSLPMAYQIKGKFNPDLSPHIKLPMSWLNDPSVRQITLACCVQNFKSGINEIFTPYVVLQSPGNMMRIHQNDSAANECMTSRILPMMENNDKLRQLLKASSYNAKTGFLQFPNGMFIKSCGTSKNNLQSKGIKYLIVEELKFWEDPSLLYEAIARTERYEQVRKVIICSEPDFEGSTLHNEFVKGEQHYWGWHCPKCKQLQKYEFNGEKDGKYFGLVWTQQNENGTLTDDERTNNTRLVCQHCFHEVTDIEDNRINLYNGGDYIVDGLGKYKEFKSVSWSAFVNPKKTYKQIALEYMDSKRQADNGVREHVYRFYNKKMGIFIRRGQLLEMPTLMQEAGNETSEWKEETHRFLTIDVQHDCMYWLVTAWSNKLPEARLIDWGVCIGFDELVNIKKQYHIKPIHIAIDSGDQTSTVYKETVKRGELYEFGGKKIFVPWLCLKGDGGKYTPKVDYEHPDGQRRYYGVESRPECLWSANEKFSKFHARLVAWSNFSVKTIMTKIRDGKVPFRFKYNNRADETFTKHMYSEVINQKTGRFENEDRPNHLWDCMCMSVVLALMCKCYIPSTDSQTK